MSINEILYNDVMVLETMQKLELIDELLKSLDVPDKNIDELWAIESESRIEAYQNGLLKSRPIEEVFAKYES